MPGRRAPEEARREQILAAAYAVALRTGIADVTLRAVGAEAGLSHGLLLFHFHTKDELIGALLDRVLATTVMLHLADDATANANDEGADGRVARLEPRAAPDRLAALLGRELDRLSRDPRGMRLFFEYWALGVRRPAIRKKISAALARYRAAFRSIAEELLSSAPTDSVMTPDALAAVAVSLINGCAVQMMIDPGHFDTDAYLAAVQGLLTRLAPPPAVAERAGRAR
ncbi:MAG TPA: TetR family transcriptional regulator C-terminal domain-containing protein [Gemmatimonadaceae bacterium]|nr:TetR family transcriptional regulator C-terminal domain-containing protein [Gemmatimonadaceae bacterium]